MRHSSLVAMALKPVVSSTPQRLLATAQALAFKIKLRNLGCRVAAPSRPREQALNRFRPQLAAGIALLAASCAPVAVDDGLEDYYLRGRSRGPYSGRVIDAETRQPLEGAVVVAMWRRDTFGLVHMVDKHYAAREVLTDRDGRFVIDARKLEERAPRRTMPPGFTIFLPGYAAFTSGWTTAYRYFKTEGFAEGQFGKGPVTVGLPRLKTWEERREHIGHLSPYCLSDTPFREIPEFTRLFNQERVDLRFSPYPPPGKH